MLSRPPLPRPLSVDNRIEVVGRARRGRRPDLELTGPRRRGRPHHRRRPRPRGCGTCGFRARRRGRLFLVLTLVAVVDALAAGLADVGRLLVADLGRLVAAR